VKHPIPNEALDDRFGLVGTSGSGKTYTAGGCVERVLDMGHRVVIVDPLDVWWGLRLLADGKTASPYKIAIFGGAHGDLPLSEHAGALIGETVATMAESCIVSLGELGTKSADRRFMLAFLDALYRHTDPRRADPYHIIFDEADLWAPQRAIEPGLQSRMEEIVRRGRVKGFIPWLITQRPAVLSKDVLSQVDALVAMKLTASQDRDALGAWIEGQADKADGKRILATLPSLQRGHGVVWIPSRGILDNAAFPTKKTFDSSRTPKRGERKAEAATLAPLDLTALRAKLSTVESETKANDPKALRAEISRLNSQVRRLNEESAAPSREIVEAATQAGYRAGWRSGRADLIDRVRGLLSIEETHTAVAGAPHAPAVSVAVAKAEIARTAPVAKLNGSRAAAPAADLPKGEKAVLTALAQHPAGCTRRQLSVLTGYTRRTRDQYLQNLATRGFCDRSGERMVATPAGVAALGDGFEPLPTGAALLTFWLDRLPAGERNILRILANEHPSRVRRSQIDEATGYTRRTRDQYLQQLRAKEVIEVGGRGEVWASAALFGEPS
jgi:hypothetical protein